MPPLIPVTIPPVFVTCATVVLLLVHVPPVAVLLSVVLAPWHRVVVPVIEITFVTVTVVVVTQPADEVNVIGDVPVAIPDTTPPDSVIVATVVLPLVHVPLPDRLFSVVVPPVHTVVMPVIASGLTDTLVVRTQPLEDV